jgi:hypothetical protein
MDAACCSWRRAAAGGRVCVVRFGVAGKKMILLGEEIRLEVLF